MAFYKYLGTRQVTYPTFRITVSPNDVVDFGAGSPPNDGQWQANAGPANNPAVPLTTAGLPLLRPLAGQVPVFDAGTGQFLPASSDSISAASADFTTKANGAAPTTDENGNLAAIRSGAGLNAPTVAGGKLVAVPNANTTGATYWQIPLGANGLRVGCEFTVPSQDVGEGSATLALWDHDYRLDLGQPVPQARAHFTVIPGLFTWQYYVCDGAGHLPVVASGTFSPPAYDDTARWRVDVMIDEDNGNAYLWLPDDSIVTVTAAQIAATIAGTAGWAAGNTLKSLSGLVGMIEHFASNHATSTAVLPKFTAFWAEPKPAPRARRFSSPTSIARAIQNSKGGAEGTFAAATPQNSWINSAGLSPMGYRSLGNGLIELRGYVSGGAADTACFTLPAGRRPYYSFYRATYAGPVSVGTDGAVKPQQTGGTWLDGIIFNTLP